MHPTGISIPAHRNAGGSTVVCGEPVFPIAFKLIAVSGAVTDAAHTFPGIRVNRHVIEDRQIDRSLVRYGVVVRGVFRYEPDLVDVTGFVRRRNKQSVIPLPAALYFAVRAGKACIRVFGDRRIRLKLRNRQRQTGNRLAGRVFLSLLHGVDQIARNGRRCLYDRHSKRLFIGRIVGREILRGHKLRL